MAVAVTNCRRDSFRDICSLHAEQLAVFASCASSGCAEKASVQAYRDCFTEDQSRIDCSKYCIVKLNGLAAGVLSRHSMLKVALEQAV
jgi:hypothetical protein